MTDSIPDEASVLAGELRAWALDEPSDRRQIQLRAAADAIEAEHRRANSLAANRTAWIGEAFEAQKEADELWAVVEAAEDFVSAHYLDTQMGEKLLGILAEHDKQKEN